jgi:hypothetical protein
MSESHMTEPCVECARTLVMLAANGVPEGRARTPHNGVDVLATRYRRSEDAHEAEIARLRRLLHEAKSYIHSFSLITKHPTAPQDAAALIRRIDSALRPADSEP